jgi:hypothetical protein
VFFASLAGNYLGHIDPEADTVTVLAQLRRFEYFRTPKWLRLLRPTPKGRHYSGISGTGPAVILGGG